MAQFIGSRSLICICFCLSVYIIALGNEGEDCYDYEDPRDCPQDQEPQPHGGCQVLTDPNGQPIGETNNVNSSILGCRRMPGSYCEGQYVIGYCGSDCASLPDPTGLKAIGTETNEVPATYYAADLWCSDYDLVIIAPPWVLPQTCAPICLNAQEGSQTNILVTECKTTQEGCPFRD